MESNCEVITGILEQECRRHHRRFLIYQEKKRPYILLKWAQTEDGFIAPAPIKRKTSREPYWITNLNSRQLVHQWRSEEQAILVGTTTALEDNPQLTIRDWSGKNPLRVVLDRNLAIPKNFNVLDGSTPTLICTAIKDTTKHIAGIDYEVLDFSKNVSKQIVELLYKKNISSILIEGGAKTLQSFIDAFGKTAKQYPNWFRHLNYVLE